MWALPSDAVQLLMLNGGKREKTRVWHSWWPCQSKGFHSETLYLLQTAPSTGDVQAASVWFGVCHPGCLFRLGVQSVFCLSAVPIALKSFFCTAENRTLCEVFLRNLFVVGGCKLRLSSWDVVTGALCVPSCGHYCSFPCGEQTHNYTSIAWSVFLTFLLTEWFYCCNTRVCMKKASQERFALKILLDRPKARNEV